MDTWQPFLPPTPLPILKAEELENLDRCLGLLQSTGEGEPPHQRPAQELGEGGTTSPTKPLNLSLHLTIENPPSTQLLERRVPVNHEVTRFFLWSCAISNTHTEEKISHITPMYLLQALAEWVHAASETWERNEIPEKSAYLCTPFHAAVSNLDFLTPTQTLNFCYIFKPPLALYCVTLPI